MQTRMKELIHYDQLRLIEARFKATTVDPLGQILNDFFCF